MAPADAPAFDVQRTCIDGVVVLAISGEVDLLTAPSLAAAIHQEMTVKPTALIVDLIGVDFLASVGMTVLVEAHQNGVDSSIRLAVIAKGPTTSRPLELIGLNQVLAIYPTLDAALIELG